MASRKCQNFKTCIECLAEWPYYKDDQSACKWCPHCPHVKCIPREKDCDEPNNCNLRYNTITDVNQCGERQCPASDCEKCNSLGGCIWTRQVLKTCEFCFRLLCFYLFFLKLIFNFTRGKSIEKKYLLITKYLFTAEGGTQVTGQPVYDWNCVSEDIFRQASFGKEVVGFGKKKMMQCESRCGDHKDCTSCLKGTGAEGGWSECRWSTQLNEVNAGFIFTSLNFK